MMIGYFWNLFLQKFLLNSPLHFIWLLSISLNLIGCQGDKKGKFRKNVKKKNLKTIRWMKLLLFIHAYGIILYINFIYFLDRYGPWLLWQLFSLFHCCGYTWPIVR